MDIMGLISTIIGTAEKFIPDNDKRAEMQVELQKLVNQANLQILMKQADINLEEAKRGDGEARRWFMKAATIGVVYQLIVQPFLTGVLRLFDLNPEFPGLDLSIILRMLAYLFGIG